MWSFKLLVSAAGPAAVVVRTPALEVLVGLPVSSPGGDKFFFAVFCFAVSSLLETLMLLSTRWLFIRVESLLLCYGFFFFTKN